jgi:hypothetical protein
MNSLVFSGFCSIQEFERGKMNNSSDYVRKACQRRDGLARAREALDSKAL